ncbi:hypothetical protein L21SP2_1831 [Salinispira pacifica]|uniref:Uncharacterized protein n=1 Tax=Salinispira pacifica TaxID=1307761 RepID=V5WJ60_9SPIO|nr:hypothetical protein L21SP2_1831 [Salinispira pacifica]
MWTIYYDLTSDNLLCLLIADWECGRTREPLLAMASADKSLS